MTQMLLQAPDGATPGDLSSEQLLALMREAHEGVNHPADQLLDCCFTSHHRRAVLAAYRVGYAAALGHEVTVNEGGDRVLVGDKTDSPDAAADAG